MSPLTKPLSLISTKDFPRMRYLPHTPEDRHIMMTQIGISHIDELFKDVPKEALLDNLLDLPAHADELTVERHIMRLSRQNTVAGEVPCFLGCGAYRHHVPAAVDALIQRGEFLTSYTPYQPEISQGTLQALYEFQTQVALITGMDVANGSMYDGSTACAEAVLMAGRVNRRKNVVLSGGLHPFYCDVVETLTQFTELKIERKKPEPPSGDHHDTSALESTINEDTACVVVQYPDFFGHIRDFSNLAKRCREQDSLLIIVTTEPVALGALKSPGSMGADIVVGEGQALGVGLNYGGPYVGLFAAKHKHMRQMPGRIAGETKDSDGRRGWVLTLNAREQHIRRERATSNICTNSGLCALAFSIHLSLLGEDGFRRLAQVNHVAAQSLAEQLQKVPGVKVLNNTFFNEFTVRFPCPTEPLIEKLAEHEILGGVPVSRLYPAREDLRNLALLTATETTTNADIESLVTTLAEFVR